MIPLHAPDWGALSPPMILWPSVCGAANPAAFTKLRSALMMHYHIRDQAVAALGEAGTERVIAEIVEDLRKKIGDRLGTPPPA